MAARSQKRLQRIALGLVSPNLDHDLLVQTIQAYRSFLTDHSGFDWDGDQERTDIHLSGGKAIGAAWAAKCVEDQVRTRMLVKGTFEAISSLLGSGKNKVRVLYAGCGPFATIVLPLTTLFAPSEVQFELIEINPLSLQSVKRLVKNLEAEPWFSKIWEADATTFRIGKGCEPDIILSETMQRGLLEEQQVPIVYNLFSQAGDQCILVPEKIELSIGWWNPDLDPDNRVRKIGSFFELSAAAFDPLMAGVLKEGGAVKFPEATFEIQAPDSPGGGRLTVFTDIQTHGRNHILLSESGLTTPLVLAENPAGKTRLKIGYAVREKPAIDVDFFN